MFAFVSSRSNQGQPILNLPLSHSPYLPPKLRSKVFPRISTLPRVTAHPLEPTYQTGAEIALYEIFLESQKFWTKRNHHLISYLSLNPPSPPPLPSHTWLLIICFGFIHGLAPGASCMFLLLGRLKRRRKRTAINLLPQAPIPKVAINFSDTFILHVYYT